MRGLQGWCDGLGDLSRQKKQALLQGCRIYIKCVSYY